MLDSVSDQACMSRENFQWTDWSSTLLLLPLQDQLSAFAELEFIFTCLQIIAIYVVLFLLQLEGDWFLMRVLRRDQTVPNS